MLEVTTTDDSLEAIDADAIVVGAFSSSADRGGDSGDDETDFVLTDAASQLDALMAGALSTHLESVRFDAKPKVVRFVATSGVIAAPAALVVGLGGDDACDLDTLRVASAVAARSAKKFDKLATTLASVAVEGAATADSTAACIEGSVLGCYELLDFKSNPTPVTLSEVIVAGGDAGAAARGSAAGEATALARRLANTPARDMRPRDMAAAAETVAGEGGLDVEIWDLERVKSERLGGVEAVTAGSVEEPRLIRLTYTPEAEQAGTIVIVGKGITFDSGGLNIKPADNMERQKTDMSGGAAVIGAMSALSVWKPAVRVIGIVPASENMPGSDAIKPGDVFAARNGKTVEILNTDAEGRLVLADGLSLAAEAEPDAIVDLATLTGACVMALGTRIAGLFANNDVLAAQIEAASERSGEAVWRLPLAAEYRQQIDSDIADLRNIGSRGAGAITAALFLSEFAGDVAWAHLDICGPGRSDSADGYLNKGATGFGVRLLLQLIDAFDADAL